MLPYYPMGSKSASLVLLLGSTFFALGLAELYLRHFGPFPAATLDFHPQDFDHDLEIKRWVPDPDLGFAPGPSWGGREGRFGYENGIEYDGDTSKKIDVGLLGDSIIQWRFLEKALNKSPKNANYRFWSAGIGGYNTIQEMVYLKKKITRLPQILVLGFCLNDFTPSMSVVSSADQKHYQMSVNLFEPLAAVSPWWFKHSALYRTATAARIGLTRADVFYGVAMVKNNRQHVKSAIAEMRDFTQARGIKFLVLIYPHLTSYDEPKAEWLKVGYAQILEIVQELGVKYLDVHPIFKGLDPEGLKQSPNDIVHPSQYAHDLIAPELEKLF